MGEIRAGKTRQSKIIPFERKPMEPQKEQVQTRPTLVPTQNAFDSSASIANLAKAMAVMQGQLQAASKDKTNPHFRSSYADLASCFDACRTPLSDNKLSVIQLPSANGVNASVRTILLHESGEYISHVLTVQSRDAGPQAIGSAITYLRRYSLCSVVGIAPDDDDGNAASKPVTTQYNRKPDPALSKPKPAHTSSKPAATKEVLYDPKNENQQKWLSGILMKRDDVGQSPELWDEIGEALAGLSPRLKLEETVAKVLEKSTQNV